MVICMHFPTMVCLKFILLVWIVFLFVCYARHNLIEIAHAVHLSFFSILLF